MDIPLDTPTKALLATVIRAHLLGKVVIGIDPTPTGTGKTTSGSQFFNNLEAFLYGIDHNRRLKVVIVASQHRYLGNYWTPGSHQRVIRFLGAEEYARRINEVANQPIEPEEAEERMVRDGLIPHHCPLRGNRIWLKQIGMAADRKRITLTHFRDVCGEHLTQSLPTSEPARLFEACNHACPLAGGSFFGAILPHDPKEEDGAPAPQPDRPRVALLTSAKLRYRAAAFYATHRGEVKVRTADFQDIWDAVFMFEEAADVFEVMLGYVDEMAVSTELLNTAARAHELFSRRQFEHDWIRRAYDKTTEIYLGPSKDTVVQNGQWLPVNVYQGNPNDHGDYLMPVSRDRCALVIADFPRYTLQKQVRSGVPYCFSLFITSNTDGQSTSTSSNKRKRFTANVDEGQAASATVFHMTAPLVNLVRATFSRAIKPFVKFFHWTYDYRSPIPFREYVSDELYQAFQLHSAVNSELRDLALSEIDFGSSVKSLRDRKQDIFAEDYYYKHGIAYCDVHRLSRDATERDPLKITLNVSYSPPEQLLYNLLKQRNSLIFSSATIRLKSPYTNINLDWLLRKFRSELVTEHHLDTEFIAVDDPARPSLFRLQREATEALFAARCWDARPLEVDIFSVCKDLPDEDSEYLYGYQALKERILAFNKRGVPLIGIVLVNSYDHAKELLRRLESAHHDLNISELFGINTDTSRSGLSILETWITNGEIQRAANAAPSPAHDSMLFDEIERAVSARMGPLLGLDKPRNGLVVSVIKKIGKGATFRNDLTNTKLGKCGRAYLGKGVGIDAGNPYVDFNLIAFAEHPRNLVNRTNYRRIAVQAVSVGGREMREKLSQRLRSGQYQEIQRAMKWSSFGALGVLDFTIQGDGRITRCRTPLPAHRCIIMSSKHARLVMLGMGCCDPGDILITPDLASIRDACTSYWIESTIRCEDENAGAAEWVRNIYQNSAKTSVAQLKAVRDIRMFLSNPAHHVLSIKALVKAISTALQDDYGATPAEQAIKESAIWKLHHSYILTSHEQLAAACLSSRTREYILNHGGGRLSAISYRQKNPVKRSNRDIVVLLKPRELYELAYPAADEAAILKVLEGLPGNTIAQFQVQSALDHAHFMGPILNGTHEAGDFYLQISGINILLDAKTTAVRSPYNPEMRDVDSVRKEVLSKTKRFTKGTGIQVDAFVFANSGWDCQNMWYRDDLPGSHVHVYHMDACTTLSPAKMAIEFSRTLTEIVTHICQERSAHARQSK